jgi:Dolichyl-phosphate-mannose-protein mannosyltransferase
VTAVHEQSADLTVLDDGRSSTRVSRSRCAEPLAVAAIVLVAFSVYGVLSSQVQSPRIFVDETIYMDAAGSLAQGHGLETRGQAYGWAPAYPVALAPILLATRDRPDAYSWIKLANALLFALAAIPIYLVARRLLPWTAALTIAALAVALPSSVYVGLVMTESLAYLVFCVVVYLLARTVERPTAGRQIAVLAAIALAYLVRPQFAALYPSYLLALIVVQRPLWRRTTARMLWPTVLSVALAVCGVVGLAGLRGSQALGRYDNLWRSYSPVDVARWIIYHVADFALYLGLVPLVLLPVVLIALRRRAVAGAAAARAFLAVFVSVNVFAFLVVGAFASTPYSQGRLQDRYLFYVVPLWLVAGGVWLRDGAFRHRLGLAAGGVLLLGAIAALPVDRLLVEDSWRQLVAAGSPLWTHFSDWAVAHGTTGHRAVFAAAVTAVVVAILVPRRWAWTLVAVVGLTMISNSVLLWRSGIDAARTNVFPDQSAASLAWVDAHVHGGQAVTMLYVPMRHCPSLGNSYALTEFFNDRVGRVPQFGAVDPNGLPAESVRIDDRGWVLRPSGAPLSTDWLVVPAGVHVEGSPIARGARDKLVLWRVPGHVSLRARSEGQVEAQACNGS